MTTPVLGNGPVRFTDISTGKFDLIPLTAFTYDNDGKLQSTDAVYAANKGAVDAWLAEMTSGKIIRPDADPGPNSAVEIQAQQAGSTGSDIVVTFANPRPDPNTPGSTIYDATANETDTYPQLKLKDLENTIGKKAGDGSRPTLVYVAAKPAGMPAAAKIALTLTGGKYQAKFLQLDPKKEAFTLVSRGEKADGGQHITAEVQSPDTTSFTLIVSFAKTITVKKAADLNSDADGLGFVITASDVGANSLTAIPVAGRVSLRGGADAANANQATTASAVVGSNK